MDIRKLQRTIVDGLEDVKAQDIVVFNTEHLSAMFERVVIASGTSNRQTKSLAASADGARLYVGIGSNSNVGERGMAVEEERAVVWEIDRLTGARRTIATGVRNPTALAIERVAMPAARNSSTTASGVMMPIAGVTLMPTR